MKIWWWWIFRRGSRKGPLGFPLGRGYNPKKHFEMNHCTKESKLPGHKEVSKTSFGSIKQVSPVHNCLTFCNCASSEAFSILQSYSTLWVLNKDSVKYKCAVKGQAQCTADIFRPDASTITLNFKWPTIFNVLLYVLSLPVPGDCSKLDKVSFGEFWLLQPPPPLKYHLKSGYLGV